MAAFENLDTSAPPNKHKNNGNKPANLFKLMEFQISLTLLAYSLK